MLALLFRFSFIYRHIQALPIRQCIVFVGISLLRPYQWIWMCHQIKCWQFFFRPLHHLLCVRIVHVNNRNGKINAIQCVSCVQHNVYMTLTKSIACIIYFLSLFFFSGNLSCKVRNIRKTSWKKIICILPSQFESIGLVIFGVNTGIIFNIRKKRKIDGTSETRKPVEQKSA